MDEVINTFLHLLRSTELLIKGSKDAPQNQDLADFLGNFRTRRVNPLFKRLQSSKCSPYVLSMVGLTNVGKSTLANALLSHPVAPHKNGPATAVPVKYKHSDSWSITTHIGEYVESSQFESSEDLSKALQPKVFNQQGQTTDGKGIRKIIVYGPMDLLEGGIILADTPGFGAAQADGKGSSHEDTLVKHLKEHVQEVMFCVSGDEAVVGASETEFFKKIQELCSTVIVTKWTGQPHDIKKYIEKFSSLFPGCEFVFVEAKKAIKGEDQTSIKNLIKLIKNRNTKEARIAAIGVHFVSAWNHLQELKTDQLRISTYDEIPWAKAELAEFQHATKNLKLQFISPP
jgi:GTPase Era involved in 16S rRNA processing